MRKRNKKSFVSDIDKSNGAAKTFRQKIYKFAITCMTGKGSEMSITDNRVQNRLSIFHAGIIASLLMMALGGCGYKTDPVYVPPKDQVQSNHVEKV
jgi:predicted small lipoprotein YifL